MQIVMTEKHACIFTPYNPDFVERIKKIGNAKWKSNFWLIPAEAVDAAREIMRDVYGYDDTMENDTVNLRLTFLEEVSAEKSSVTCFAKVLAHAFSRDSGARIGDDVAFIKGGGKSGGSAKNWRTIVEKGSIAMLYRVNRNIYNAWEDDPRIEVKLMKDNGVTLDTDDHKWQERLVRMITEDGK